MSNYDDDDFLDDDNGQESGALREVRKAQRAAEKRAKELEARLAEYESKERQRNLASLLEQRGLNPKISAFVPSDVVDEDAIGSWLDEYGDVFGVPTPQQGTAEQQEQAPGYDPGLNAAFNDVANGGTPPTGDEAQLLSSIAAAKTPEDLNRLLFGNNFGPRVQ